jgi:hypothetical protein
MIFARTLFTTSEWLWRDLQESEHQGWMNYLLPLQDTPEAADAPDMA